MVHGYGTIEAVEWAMGTPKTPLVCLIHGMKVGLQVLGPWAKKSITPGQDSFNKAHFIMLQQTDIVTPYVNEHLGHLCEGNPNHNEAWIAKKYMQGFNTWLRDYVQRASIAITDNVIRKLAAGPLFTITTYQAYDINGYTFYTMA